MLIKIILFLVGAIADFFTFMLLARFLMQVFRVSFANPIGETVVGLSNWVVKPLRRMIPGLFGIDLSSLLPAWLLQSLLLLITWSLASGSVAASGGLVAGVLFAGAIDALRVGVYVLIVALIAAAIASWVNPYSPIAAPAIQLSRPMLRPIQRILPTISGIDLSPLLAILLLQVALMLLDGFKGSALAFLLR